ncbi:YceD family protein [Bacillus niameyensis]|uniref:YceD family protein n=1 Tax=Bacillus niameyensis TaxID=1522308 RepID=UPI00078076F9|nr:YceD family protein [Bacillus niameyensis]
MKWTVAQLQKFRNQNVNIDQTVDVSENLLKRDPEIRAVTPIQVTGTMDVNREKVEFHLHLTGTLTLPCARTLVDTEYPIDIHSSEVFLLMPDDRKLDDDEEDIHEPIRGVVDLNPVIEELLIVEVPLQVFSDEALKEDVQTGKDWTVMTEEQYQLEKQNAEKPIDPRLAGLKDVLKDKDH